jgi:Holliday junction resolvase
LPTRTLSRPRRPDKQKATDAQVIAAYQKAGSVKAAGRLLGIGGGSVHERLKKLGVACPKKARPWTAAEEATIRKCYAQYRGRGTVKTLAARLGRDYSTLATKAKEMGLSAHPKVKPFLRSIPNETAARRWFDRFKRSSLVLAQFCAKFKISDDAMRTHVASRWPDEWDAVIESKAPRQTRYRLGRHFEYRTRDLLRDAGYFVMRSPRSLSIVDLVAIKTGRVVFIQCKRSGGISSTDWNKLFDLAASVGAVPVLAECSTGRGTCLWRMTGRKDGVKRAQPRESFLP